MNTEMMNRFEELVFEQLDVVSGGSNIGAEFIAASWAGCGLGSAIAGLAGCIIGAQYAPVLWTAIRLR